MSTSVAGRASAELDRLSEAFRVRDCPRCGLSVLRGLDLGCELRLDLVPLHPATEALCILAGRRTYDVRPQRGGAEVLLRDSISLQGRRLLGKGYPDLVLPTHLCKETP